MKTSSVIALGLVLGSFGCAEQTTSSVSASPTPTPCSYASSTWTNIDTFQYVTGQDSTANAVEGDSSGNLYSAGYGVDGSSISHWIVRKSTDRGVTWSTVDDFNYASSRNASATGVAITSAGVIYVTGNARGSDNTVRWIVRKSSDGGTTWSNVMVYQETAGFTASGTALAIEPSTEAILTAGYHYTSGGGGAYTWALRRSEDAGTTWTTVDSYSQSASPVYTQTPSRITSDPATGKVYVSGSTAPFSTLIYSMVVREGTRSGSTYSWSTILNYALESGSTTNGSSVSVGNDGALFVTGHGQSSGVSGYQALVRKSTDASTWSTVKNFQRAANATSYFYDSAVTTNGAIYVAGGGVGDDAKAYWEVHASSDDGNTWSQSDQYLYGSPGLQGYANAISVSGGNSDLISAGWSQNTSGGKFYILRQLKCIVE